MYTFNTRMQNSVRVLQRGLRNIGKANVFVKKENKYTNLPFAKTLLTIAIGGGVFTTAMIGAWITVQPEQIEEHHCQCSCAARIQTFDLASKTYDTTVGRDEFFMGMPLLRWWLLRSAKGNVLELAAGTGSNLSYYPSDCQVTATDASRSMLQKAATKINDTKKKNVLLLRVAVEDIPRLLLHTENNKRFDTVVDTFGLCSVEDPILALRTAQAACVHPTSSRILLLEHGRSYFSWINHHLDKYAAKHLQKWGCSWNRDILQIVKDAGLIIESSSRWHFGTTYLIIARPNPDFVSPATTPNTAAVSSSSKFSSAVE